MTNLYASSGKLNTDRRFGLQVELVASESWKEVTLPDTRVADQHDCKCVYAVKNRLWSDRPYKNLIFTPKVRQKSDTHANNARGIFMHQYEYELCASATWKLKGLTLAVPCVTTQKRSNYNTKIKEGWSSPKSCMVLDAHK